MIYRSYEPFIIQHRQKQQTNHCEINEGEGELSSSPHLYRPSGEELK